MENTNHEPVRSAAVDRRQQPANTRRKSTRKVACDRRTGGDRRSGCDRREPDEPFKG